MIIRGADGLAWGFLGSPAQSRAKRVNSVGLFRCSVILLPCNCISKSSTIELLVSRRLPTDDLKAAGSTRSALRVTVSNT